MKLAPPTRVLEALYAVNHIGSRLRPGALSTVVDALALGYAEEALGNGAVRTTSDSAH